MLVHRDELVRQAAAAFEQWGPRGLRVGVEKGKERVRDPSQVGICIIQSIEPSRPFRLNDWLIDRSIPIESNTIR